MGCQKNNLVKILFQVRLVSSPREWVEREAGDIHLWLSISPSLQNKQVIINLSSISYCLLVNLLLIYLLASQSDAHRIAPHRDPIHPTHPIHPTYSSKARKTHDVIYFFKRKSYKDLKNNVPK